MFSASINGNNQPLFVVDGVILEDLREAVRQLSRARGEPYVTLSAGAVAFARPDVGVEEALARADDTMYRAKQAGKDRVLIEQA